MIVYTHKVTINIGNKNVYKEESMMIHKCIVMKVFSGMQDEYKKRHNEIWTKMVEVYEGGYGN